MLLGSTGLVLSVHTQNPARLVYGSAALVASLREQHCHFATLPKIQFPRTLGRSLYHKFAAREFLGKRITAHARPVFATKRNTGKFATATRAKVAVDSFPRFSLVCLRDWCITAKFIADRNAFRRSDTDAFFVRVLVLPDPVKVEAQGRM